MLDVELIVLVHFLKLQAIRVILIYHFESQFGLLITDIFAHLLHHHLKLLEIETSPALLVEIIENFLQR